MKKWTKKLLVLAAAMAMCMLLGTMVYAEVIAQNLPLDGKERLYTKPTATEEEPDQVGGDLLSNKYYPDFTNNGWGYYKIFVTGYGQLRITGRTANNGSLGIQLLNHKGYYQNPRGVESDVRYTNSANGNDLYYGVQRGTYYVKVYSTTNEFKLGAYFDKKANRAGSTKAKSYKLSYNKTITGVMPCNENWSNKDWYTFYLSSDKRIRIYFAAKGLGYINATLYGPGISSKGERLYYYDMNFNDVTTLYKTINGSGKYPRSAGRYYIKIARSSKSYPRTSCAYSLRWNAY